MRRYLACLVVVPALGWFAAFFVARWPAYWRHGPSLIGTMCNYADGLVGRADDVVIFGDSSAMFGLDAGLLSRDLNVRAVNLPNTMGTINVRDDGFPLRFWEQVGFAYGLERNDFHQHARDMAARHGNLPDRGGDNLTPDCALPGKVVALDGRGTIEALTRQYGVNGQRVLVYLSPMPDCAGAAIVAGRSYGVRPPKVWPVERFRDDGGFAHMDPRAVDESTRGLEEAVRERLQ